jgi:hypothetical protein
MEKKTLDEGLMPVYDKYHSTWKKLLSEGRGEKDFRAKHFELLVSDLAEHINIIKCVNVLGQKYPKDIEEVTNYSREQVELLLGNFHDTIISDCFLKLVMKTELLFRTLYGILNAGADASKATIPQLIALLVGDTENNWQKEESKLLLMLWDARNSIHMSGIYSKADKTHTYKGKSYEFKKDMRGVPFSTEELFDIMLEITDVVDEIIHSAAVSAIPDTDHPFYKVFGK